MGSTSVCTHTANLLLADDDPMFCEVLGAALERRGFRVRVAHDGERALRLAKQRVPSHAVVDLRMPGRSGLQIVSGLHEIDASMRIIVLTGYASIATAVEAIKLGATHYLTKPADADEIVAAFERDGGETTTPVPGDPMSVDRLEWEHIQRVLTECRGNVSATARRLGMHRRTLQRKLQKPPIIDPTR